jgi:hypothetical protein
MTNGFYIPVATSVAVCMKAFWDARDAAEDAGERQNCPECDDECQECPDCVDNPDIPDCMKPVEINGKRHFC